MPRQPKLKVYRTPIGFHDAYVAAPSQKAALAAWGSDANLFARGVAELVTDEALTREPLDKPGEVIRRPRGTTAEYIAALPKDAPPRPRPAPPSGDDEGPPSRRRGTSRARAREKAVSVPAAPEPGGGGGRGGGRPVRLGRRHPAELLLVQLPDHVRGEQQQGRGLDRPRRRLLIRRRTVPRTPRGACRAVRHGIAGRTTCFEERADGGS
jgi:hypothetical protein